MNLRHLAPKASALAKLSYTPKQRVDSTSSLKRIHFDLKKIKNVDMRKLKIGKYNMLERKTFLEKKLSSFLNENDYIVYCTSLYKDYIKNLKSYVFKEKESSLTYALPIELIIFPLNFTNILWCQYLPFI